MQGLLTFSDPNYAPAIAYRGIEPTLFFSDKIFLFAPNANAIAGVTDTPRKAQNRLLELISRGFVVPVARPVYWDRVWRRERTQQFRRSNPERSKHYQWTSLDDRMVETGKIEVLPNDFFVSITTLTEQLPSVQATEFQQFVSQVTEIKSHLPEQLRSGEYRTWSADRLAKQVLHMALGDLKIARHLGTKFALANPAVARVYNVVQSRFEPRSVSYASKVAISDGVAELTDDDLRVAKEFAISLVDRFGPLDLDLLKVYRESRFHKAFMALVTDVTNSLDASATGASVHGKLWSEFEQRLESPRMRIPVRGPINDAIKYVIPVGGAAWIAKSLQREMRRRLWLKIAGVVALGWVAEMSTQGLPTDVTIEGNDVDRMITLIGGPRRHPSVW